MPTTFLSRFKVKAGKEDDFVDLIAAAEDNASREADTLAYKFYKLEEPRAFAVYESFTNDDADLAHQQNPENAPIIEKMIECIDGTYEREYLYDVKS
ncbi:putative quinol monooxygenase [Aurantiacibacter odishensis]|uniref:putative quinol monooxygenase n=1 Tax=Aurantiacibacter odishensis TaxID=1155476 RepID=UPI000E74763E|nr:antibiotic biosynthesis monooxygenase [Aurantiacibacter odishensis]